MGNAKTLVRYYNGGNRMDDNEKSEDTKTDGVEDVGDKLDGLKEELHEINKTLQLIVNNMPVGYDPK